jgi:hypothetical protein
MKGFKLWIVLLALPAVGFTNCSSFSEVTVPANDTAAPLVGSRVYEPGESDVVRFGSVSYETHDPNGTWYLAPFGFDAGGMHTLSVGTYSDRRCCYPNSSVCGWITTLSQTTVDSENANPGDTVSNGRYLWFNFKPSTSYGSRTCDIHRFGYLIQAVDQAGNISTGTASVTYTAPDPVIPGGGGYLPIIGGSGSSDSCDEAEGTTCSTRPSACQYGFMVDGTWQCLNGNDKCVPPPEGIPGSYCAGPWDGSKGLGCGRGMLQSGWEYGSACTAGGSITSRCMPGTKCISGLHPQHGSACGPVPACGTLPTCWYVDQAANVCSVDDWR